MSDAGSSTHICGHRDWFTDYKKYRTPTEMQGVGKAKVLCFGEGTVQVEAYIDKRWLPLIIHNVKHVPGAWNLFSELQYLNQLRKNQRGWYLKRKYNRDQFMNEHTYEVCPMAAKDDTQLIQFMIFREPRSRILMALQPKPGVSRSKWWHERFGHMSIDKIRKSVLNKAIKGVPLEDLKDNFQCLVCDQAKMKRRPYPRKPLSDQYGPGERWHIDIADGGGLAYDKSKYILVCKDEAIGYKILYYLKKKSEAQKCMKSLIEWVYTQVGVKVKSNREIKDFCQKRGIEHHMSAPYHPQSNGVVERENRTNQEGIIINKRHP